MNPFAIEAVNRDNDLAAQARSETGASVPSPNLRDGDAAAANPRARTDEPRGAAVGGGAVAGAAAGAAVGTVVGGPGGAMVGGVVGAVTGALGGVAAVPAHPDDAGETIPGPQEREVNRVGELHQENLRR